MKASILEGNVSDVLPTLTPGSVDCVCTSPPYWQLRSYLPKGHALKALELGGEPTPAEYLANMVKVFGLVREAMAEHATCWLNVGDTYLHDSRGGRSSGKHSAWHGSADEHGKVDTTNGQAAGSLALIPQRLAIALADNGWLVRSVVVWHKPACMPASLSGWQWRRCRVKVKAQPKGQQDSVLNGAPRSRDMSNGKYIGAALFRDCPGCKKCSPYGGYVLRRGSWRPTSSWEPILMLAKSPRYFADGEAVKRPAASATVSRNQYTRVIDDPDEQFAVRHDHETVGATANLRDVWQTKLGDLSKEELIDLIRGTDDGSLSDVFRIPAEPLREKHYAAFPTELVHRCLKAGTSARGYCPACGMPWCRVVETEFIKSQETNNHTKHEAVHGLDKTKWPRGSNANSTLGWRPSCRCPEQEPRPGLVLDPFAGSGRTGIEANMLGLDFVGVELNPEYVGMARRLLRDEFPLFAGADR